MELLLNLIFIASLILNGVLLTRIYKTKDKINNLIASLNILIKNVSKDIDNDN